MKKLHMFSFSMNMANFEAFHWTKMLISILFFLKSEIVSRKGVVGYHSFSSTVWIFSVIKPRVQYSLALNG